MLEDDRTLEEVGERAIVRQILHELPESRRLIDGYGHDGTFLDLPIAPDELLVVNTDRSGLNLAYQLGLADAECVGDLGVSHAISDVVAAGGLPKAVTVALLLPPTTTVGFTLGVMRGVVRAANRYGAVVAGGDTKKNPKFAIVVTALATVPRKQRLGRSGACKGDVIAVTGSLGNMLMGTVVSQRKLPCSSAVRSLLERALVEQRPPFELGRALAEAQVAHACVDISDGLSGALFSVCEGSDVGALIDERRIPVHPEVVKLAAGIELRPIQLALAGGDWQYLYAIPAANLADVARIGRQCGTAISVIGEFVGTNIVAARAADGRFRPVLRIEHDSFGRGLKGMRYFDALQQPLSCYGEELSTAVREQLLQGSQLDWR